MLRQSLILLLVPLEVLLRATLHGYRYTKVLIIVSLQHKERLLMSDDLRVNGIACRPTERQVIYRIQHIGLTHPVPANEAVHLGRQLQRSLCNILIIEYR